MKALYTQTSIIGKLKKAFFEIFSEESRHTKERLFDMLLSVLCLNSFRSVSYHFEHFIEPVSDNRLKSYYFTLNESKINLLQWMKNMVRTALSVIPENLSEHLIIVRLYYKSFWKKSRLRHHYQNPKWQSKTFYLYKSSTSDEF